MNGGQTRIALSAIVLVGAALRLWGIGAQPLWADEALTAVIAHAPPWTLATEPLDPSGPVYYWLHQLFVPMDAGPAGMRAIGAVCGILVIPMSYALGREILDRKGALLAAALVSLSFPLIDYSKEARAYSLLTLLFCVAAWLAMRAAREEKASRRRWLLAGFCAVSVAALYTHLVAFILVGCWMFAMRVTAGRAAMRIRRSEVYAAVAAIGIAAVPEVRRMYLYVRDGAGFAWLKNMSPSELVSLVAREWMPAGSLLGPVLSALLLALICGALVMAREQLAAVWRDRPLGFAIVAVWLAQPLLLWLFGMLVTPVLMQRTMLPSWPAFALTLALGLGDLKGRKWLFAGAAMIAGYAASLMVTGLNRHKEDWAGVAGRIAATRSQVAIACPAWKAPALLAAMDSSRRGAVLVFWNGQWRLIERSPNGSWAEGYARSIWAREKERWIGEAPPVQLSEVTLPDVTWVESECSDSAAMAAVAKLGGVGGRPEAVGGRGDHDPALAEPAPIAVTALKFGQSVRLRVVRAKD